MEGGERLGGREEYSATRASQDISPAAGFPKSPNFELAVCPVLDGAGRSRNLERGRGSG